MNKPSLREAIHLEINAPGSITKARLRTILAQHEDAKQPVMETIHGIMSLGNGSVIQDKHGDVAERRDGLWCGYETSPMTDAQMAKYLPATVLKVGRK